jgi:hypothetical protein
MPTHDVHSAHLTCPPWARLCLYAPGLPARPIARHRSWLASPPFLQGLLQIQRGDATSGPSCAPGNCQVQSRPRLQCYAEDVAGVAAAHASGPTRRRGHAAAKRATRYCVTISRDVRPSLAKRRSFVTCDLSLRQSDRQRCGPNGDCRESSTSRLAGVTSQIGSLGPPSRSTGSAPRNSAVGLARRHCSNHTCQRQENLTQPRLSGILFCA